MLARTTVAALLALGAPALAEDSTDPIRLTLNDWTGQLVSAHIMGEVLKKAALNVEYGLQAIEGWCRSSST